MGRTHRPFIRYEKNVLLLNVGSCGLPRDIGIFASCAIYDPISHSAKIIRLEIDIEKRFLNLCSSDLISLEVIDCLQRK